MLHLHDECDNYVSLLAPERLVTPHPWGLTSARSGPVHRFAVPPLLRQEGPPIKEFHSVIRPAPAPATDPTTGGAQEPEARRSRPRWRFALGLLAVLAIAGSASACSPEEVAKLAIKAEWGANAPCAERIVNRESRFQAGAVNPRSGTTGLFQLHPVHAPWIKRTFGYEFAEMKDPVKNAQVAKALSDEAYRMYKDGWQPWRLGGGRVPGGGCPA